MVETRTHASHSRPPQGPSGLDDEVASRIDTEVEEQDGTNDIEYDENQEEYDAYADVSYTKLMALRQKAVDHEAELAEQKEQNRKIQEIMVDMQKAMEIADIHEKVCRGARSHGRMLALRTGRPKERIVHQELGERGKNRKNSPIDLRKKLNAKHGDLRNLLEKKKQAIPVLEGALNEGILAELAILQKDIAKQVRQMLFKSLKARDLQKGSRERQKKDSLSKIFPQVIHNSRDLMGPPLFPWERLPHNLQCNLGRSTSVVFRAITSIRNLCLKFPTQVTGIGTICGNQGEARKCYSVAVQQAIFMVQETGKVLLPESQDELGPRIGSETALEPMEEI
uniref:Uncharacterized protein n=1 Tax=Cannabis sativa TaxID=3483 RepID=A0A803PD05_CANSA